MILDLISTDHVIFERPHSSKIDLLTPATTSNISDVDYKNIKIPNNFADFVDSKTPKWLHKAITALLYQENIDYVVREDLIKSVSYYIQ
ncbi:unnamed protein product, partial [Rotaria magnacalcarata]